MSDIAKLNLALVGVVVTLAAVVFAFWPAPEYTSAYSAVASPYCVNRSFDATIAARAAYVKDLATGEVLYDKNANTQLALASLTKLMTVLAASDVLSRDDTVLISREALAPEGGGIREGEVWKVSDLIDYTLITSDNDGAHALALATSERAGQSNATFIDRMNTKATALGMVQTYYTNDTGLDFSESVGGSYGSAHDIALLLEYIVNNAPRLVEASALKEKTFLTITGEEHEAENTTGVVAELDGVVASKTGFTDIAGRNLGVVFEPVLGHPIAAVILGSTTEDRDNDMRVLGNAAKKWLTRAILCGYHGY